MCTNLAPTSKEINQGTLLLVPIASKRRLRVLIFRDSFTIGTIDTNTWMKFYLI